MKVIFLQATFPSLIHGNYRKSHNATKGCHHFTQIGDTLISRILYGIGKKKIYEKNDFDVSIKPGMTGKYDIKQGENGIYLDTDGLGDVYIKPTDLELFYKRVKGL